MKKAHHEFKTRKAQEEVEKRMKEIEAKRKKKKRIEICPAAEGDVKNTAEKSKRIRCKRKAT